MAWSPVELGMEEPSIGAFNREFHSGDQEYGFLIDMQKV
jgi:hypothetical protein